MSKKDDKTKLSEKTKNLNEIEKTENALTKIVRADLNLEKWPGIFIPAQSRTKPKLRVLERTKVLENGGVMLSTVTVDPSVQYGNLTTEDQKVWYGLLELWERAGRPKELVFSLSQLAKVLGRIWSSETGESLKRSLIRLSRNSLSWVNSYYDSETKKTLEQVDEFHILSELRIVILTEDHKINNEQCRCKFSELLYQNLVNNYTKPTFLDIVLKFKSGVAQLLYKYLELVMHNKTNYERNSKELFIDLCLEGEEYKYISRRRRILETAITEVNNAPIPSGVLQVNLEQTKDQTDWKIVVKKLPHVTIDNEDEQAGTETQETALTNELKQTPNTPKTLEEQIVLFFLEKFRLPRKTPLKNELQLAKQWIKTYNLDLEKGQAFVNYAKTWAAETNFAVQNFAGLKQYLDRISEKLALIDVAREIAKCKLCDSDGTIDCKEPGSRTYFMKCSHSLETLQQYANKHKVKVKLSDETILEPKT